MKHPDLKIISGEIEKKGRKYYHVDINNKSRKVLITDSIKGKKVGDTLIVEALPVLKEWNERRYRGDIWGQDFMAIQYYAPIDSEEAEQKTQEYIQKEADRWSGYVQEAINKGYLYEKGIRKLRELGANEEADRLVNIQRQKEIDYEVAYIRKGIHEGYECPKTMNSLRHKKGCEKIVAQLEAEWEEKARKLIDPAKIAKIEAEWANNLKEKQRGDVIRLGNFVRFEGVPMKKTFLSDLLQDAELIFHGKSIPTSPLPPKTILIKNDQIFCIVHEDCDEENWRTAIIEEKSLKKNYGAYVSITEDLKEKVEEILKIVRENGPWL